MTCCTPPAVVRYPVFVRGQNWSGYTPDMFKTPLLRRFIVEVLGGELARTPHALVVPVGKSVNTAVRLLVCEGLVDEARCLFGLPHPSGQNVHGPAQFARVRDELAERVQAFYHSAV